MKTVRLLPIVVVAAGALLVLKSIGIITHGGYVLTGVDTVQAQHAPAPTDAASSSAPIDPNSLTKADLQAADKASNALLSETPPPADANGEAAAIYSQNTAGERVPIGETAGMSPTERAVLERLAQRRTELDKLQAELDQRSAVIAAAEARLNKRVEELQALETKITALVDQKKTEEDSQFKGLVGMYETMKAKDAAAIFDQLSIDVLKRVAVTMNPRKMSDILANMSTQRAQELTAALAQREPEPSLDHPIDQFADLPQIVGQ